MISNENNKNVLLSLQKQILNDKMKRIKSKICAINIFEFYSER